MVHLVTKEHKILRLVQHDSRCTSRIKPVCYTLRLYVRSAHDMLSHREDNSDEVAA
jgi:hypothetical protein